METRLLHEGQRSENNLPHDDHATPEGIDDVHETYSAL